MYIAHVKALARAGSILYCCTFQMFSSWFFLSKLFPPNHPTETSPSLSLLSLPCPLPAPPPQGQLRGFHGFEQRRAVVHVPHPVQQLRAHQPVCDAGDGELHPGRLHRRGHLHVRRRPGEKKDDTGQDRTGQDKTRRDTGVMDREKERDKRGRGARGRHKEARTRLFVCVPASSPKQVTEPIYYVFFDRPRIQRTGNMSTLVNLEPKNLCFICVSPVHRPRSNYLNMYDAHPPGKTYSISWLSREDTAAQHPRKTCPRQPSSAISARTQRPPNHPTNPNIYVP